MDALCGVICNAGPNGEPLACAYAPGHDGAHSWATLPTFTKGEVRYRRESETDPPFDGLACPACNMAARNLGACIFNYLSALEHGESDRTDDKLLELLDALKLWQPIADAHFANHHHAYGDVR